MNYGHFDDQAREYVVTRPDTPRPWSNYLGGADFGAVVTNNAAGYTFYNSAAQGRLTRFLFNASPANLPGKFVYLRDAESGDFWSNSWMPVGKPTAKFASECRHGAGYSIIRGDYAGIAGEVGYFIPLGKHYEVWQIRVRNESDRPRKLSVFPFVEPQCNWNAEDDGTNLQYTQYISRTACLDGMIDIGSNVNMPVDPEHFENKDQKRHTFFALSGIEPAGFDADLGAFLGPYGGYSAPDAVVAGHCRNSSSAGDMPCGAFQVDLDLGPGEERTFAVLFGVGEAGQEGRQARREMDSPAKIEAALEAVKAHWHGKLNRLSATTPDAGFNSMLNMWAPYNNLMTFYWSRTASMVYAGERDGLGYRDTVQDIVGAAGIVPEEAGPRLELMLTGQCSTGGAMPVVKPFAHNPGRESLPDHYRADDCLWLFNAVPEYIKETGDFAFYKRVLPYADRGEDTVFAHLRRAIDFSLERSGSHGLPCGLHADWNDCIRLGERGESVFVAFQLRLALREYQEIARRLGEAAEEQFAQQELARLDRDLDRFAWDGDWYLRAYREDGMTFGSQHNREGRIFMNPQTWAVLSGHATGAKASQCLHAMEKHLTTDYGTRLCAPAYVATDPAVCLGRLFNPGMKENGGIFNHTQGWAVMAHAMQGDAEKAWQQMRAVMPASFNDMAEIRQVEPYVVCQSTHSPESPRFGAGRVSWLSGSGVWNYVAMSNAILGIKPHYDGLEIAPCIPAAWPGFEATREFRGCRFEISVVRGPDKGLSVNGVKQTGNLIPTEVFEPVNEVRLVI